MTSFPELAIGVTAAVEGRSAIAAPDGPVLPIDRRESRTASFFFAALHVASLPALAHLRI
ncbi:hypothetical protein [Methylocystis sp. ATCC 49242]|uniref:hypothetical protein n=1 Tax=Methylocystis sp. ATCC 49242 TaxID=622637 RepID=UPI0002D7C3D2|nr:hypothetical protein [Methylocystis sp. ATCC 49242]